MSISRKELRLVVNNYKFYYEKVSKIENYIFKMSDSRAIMIENFVKQFKEINKTPLLQEVALKKFMEFQFNHWYKRDGKFGKGISIQIEWIIGKIAIERWVKVNKKHISFVVRKNLKTDNDLRDKNVKHENWNDLVINTNVIEEINKSKFINKSIGYESCLLTTNLYNHKSSNCMICKFSEKCKVSLKILYPKINKIRGY